MGDFLKAFFERRHINAASVARAMGVEPTSFPSYFRSKVLSDAVLRRISKALELDVYTLVKAEQARVTMGPSIGQPAPQSGEVQEPPISYVPATGMASPNACTLVINLDEFADDVQLRILRYVQQQPRRGSSRVSSSA